MVVHPDLTLAGELLLLLDHAPRTDNKCDRSVAICTYTAVPTFTTPSLQ